MKIPKRAAEALRRVLEAFAWSAAGYLEEALGTPAAVRSISAYQLPFREYHRAIPTPATLAVASIGSRRGAAVLEIGRGVAFAAVDRLLGGGGVVPEALRPHTQIEGVLLEDLVRGLLVRVERAWAQVRPVRLEFEALRSNPNVVRPFSPDEEVLLAAFEVRVGEVAGTLNVCLPSALIERLGRGERRRSGRPEKKTKERRRKP